MTQLGAVAKTAEILATSPAFAGEVGAVGRNVIPEVLPKANMLSRLGPPSKFDVKPIVMAWFLFKDIYQTQTHTVKSIMLGFLISKLSLL